MRIEYHRTLIADRVRNDAIYQALATLIRQGETTVADIGAGTGLIGLMAAKLGAREVFLYEVAEVAGVAAQILKANRATNCHLIPCHSTDMRDPTRVDLVVSETLGNYPFEENIIATLNDARQRFLKPGGVMVPNRLDQYIVPVISSRIAREFTAWDSVGYGLDFAAAKTLSLNNIYVRTVRPDELLYGDHHAKGNSAQVWDSIDFTRKNSSRRKGAASWVLANLVSIEGFATWWTAELAPSIPLSTTPYGPPTHWEQLYFPLLRPMEAEAGDTVAIALRSHSTPATGTHIAWTATRKNAQGHEVDRQALDLDKGFLP